MIFKENGVKPPVWEPIKISFTNTSAFQSTAPKFNKISFPFHEEGTVKVRLYHNSFFSPTSFCTPDKEDSTANGTKIFPSKLVGSACPFGRIAYSHSPFKFCQSARSIPGRGYSGNTFRGSTFSAQSVLILSPAGFHCAPALQIVANAQKANNNFLMILFTF